LLSRLGHTLFITWGPYAAFHGMARKCHIEGSMITAVWTHLRMFLNSKFYYFMFKCCILLKPVLGGVDGNLHFPVPSMNRLNQTEPATFSILPCWDFFRDSVFIYFIVVYVCWKDFEINIRNLVVVLVVFTRDHDSKPHWIHQRTVQPPHRFWTGF
jgi:hypothetical protein